MLPRQIKNLHSFWKYLIFCVLYAIMVTSRLNYIHPYLVMYFMKLYSWSYSSQMYMLIEDGNSCDKIIYIVCLLQVVLVLICVVETLLLHYFIIFNKQTLSLLFPLLLAFSVLSSPLACFITQYFSFYYSLFFNVILLWVYYSFNICCFSVNIFIVHLLSYILVRAEAKYYYCYNHYHRRHHHQHPLKL